MRFRNKKHLSHSRIISHFPRFIDQLFYKQSNISIFLHDLQRNHIEHLNRPIHLNHPPIIKITHYFEFLISDWINNINQPPNSLHIDFKVTSVLSFEILGSQKIKYPPTSARMKRETSRVCNYFALMRSSSMKLFYVSLKLIIIG